MNEIDKDKYHSLDDRLKRSRELLSKCLMDINPNNGWHGSEWSVGDLLAHLSDPFYQNLTRSILDGKTELADYDLQAEWTKIVHQALGSIDDALNLLHGLTPKDMDLSGVMDGETITALDAIELCAAHVEEHVAQLKDEVRPREGLPSV